jgi:putative ABC transport system permease protein
MPPLARRNLFRDKIRLGVTLTGVVFAVVLIIVQMGLFIGFTRTTSGLIDHSTADLWVVPKHMAYLEATVPFSERKLYRVLSTPGVAAAEKFIVHLSDWQRPDGGDVGIQIVGVNPDSVFQAVWNVAAGSVNDLKMPDAVLIDELYAQKLGVTHLGQVFEIRGHRARVVGLTRGIRAFTTTPYVFTSFKNAQTYTGLAPDQTLFILVKAASSMDIHYLKQLLARRLDGVDVFTTSEFSNKIRFYWMFSTGAGIAVLLAAFLGLVVGVVVVAQTIYATTVDHLREFGTLKAMGASNSYVYRVIIKQAGISAVLGYVLGMGVSLAVVRGTQHGGAAILLPWSLAVAMFGLTLLMCIVAAMVSINKVTHLDPALVFKG